MSKGKITSIVSLLLLAGLFAGYRMRNPAEPSYQGRSVSEWLDDLNSPTDSVTPREALQAIGTNAVPYIIRRLKEPEPHLRKKYREVFPRLPARLAKMLPKPKAEFDEINGAQAFLAIGSSSVPILINSLKDKSPSVREAAVAALAVLRLYDGVDIREAITGLSEALHDKEWIVRYYSAEALGYLGPEAASAVPALIPLLHDPDIDPKTHARSHVREEAARALGKIGPKANAAAPALRSLLADPDNYTRMVAAVAIWRIDGDVTNTLPVLIVEIKQNPEWERWEAIEAMGEMGPRAKTAVPLILEQLRSSAPGTYIGKKAAEALKLIDPEAAATAGVK